MINVGYSVCDKIVAAKSEHRRSSYGGQIEMKCKNN